MSEGLVPVNEVIRIVQTEFEALKATFLPLVRMIEEERDDARELVRDLWWLVESLREEWDESLIRDIEERVKAAPWMRRNGTDG